LRELKRSLKTACTNAKVTYGRFEKDGFTFHDLRHTFVTHMRKAGNDRSVINAITGHSDAGMFSRYNTIDEDDLRQTVDRLENYLLSVDQNVHQVQEKG